MRPKARLDPQYWADLIGLPFVTGGRDPSTGLDCAGVVQVVYQRMGVDKLPHHLFARPYSDAGESAETAPILDAGRGHVERIERAEPGCMVGIRNESDMPDVVNHVAVVVDRERILHAVPGHNVRLDRINSKLWKIEGYYRWKI